uniref:NADH dehydrogenase subunit 2 n=1 Tax=Acrobeles complexus TaxID=293684 RepID=A0A0H3V3G5_9BILA|nr:NADH dehydrogenase subunit 2 [Acrobeles complexus]
MVLIILHLVLFVFILYSSVLLMWWGVLFLHSLVFMAMMKMYWGRFTLINYFLVQEMSGSLMLLSALWEEGLSLFLMVKMGASPLHFWVFNVCSEMPGEYLMWFMTVQKLPFMSVMSGVLNESLLLVLLFGVVVCNLQAMLHSSFRQLIILGSTDTLSWNLLWMSLESGESVFSYVLYVVSTWFLLGSVVENSDFESVESFMWVSGAPGMFGLYMKIFFVGGLGESWLGFTFVLVVFMSVLIWSFLYLTVKLSLWSKNSSKFTGVVLLFLNLFMLME